MPDYVASPTQMPLVYTNVPIFIVTKQDLDAVIHLEDVAVIRQNGSQPLLLTDRKRVLMVIPDGSNYARNVGVIDSETAHTILARI
jgi:hypothetical protein